MLQLKRIHLVFAIVLGAERISSLLVDEGGCEITYPVIVIKTMLEAEWRGAIWQGSFFFLQKNLVPLVGHIFLAVASTLH